MNSLPSLNIPEELIVMLLNEQTGYFYQVEGWTLNCVIIGAVLADLSLKSRIDTDEESLFLIDSTKTGGNYILDRRQMMPYIQHNDAETGA